MDKRIKTVFIIFGAVEIIIGIFVFAFIYKAQKLYSPAVYARISVVAGFLFMALIASGISLIGFRRMAKKTNLVLVPCAAALFIITFINASRRGELCKIETCCVNALFYRIFGCDLVNFFIGMTFAIPVVFLLCSPLFILFNHPKIKEYFKEKERV